MDVRTFQEHVAAFLRSQHPERTAYYVEIETGVPADTVRKWLELVSSPNGVATMALFRRYRMAFVHAVFRDDADGWIAELARQEEQERLEAEATAIRHRLTLVMEGRAR